MIENKMAAPWTLDYAIEIARIGAGGDGYRVYDGGGGMWAGTNNGMADAQFVDWGLAKATAVILNAVLDGRLLIPTRENDRMRCALASLLDWWDGLPNDLRQDIEGSGACPGCIAQARAICDADGPIARVGGGTYGKGR